MAFPESHRVIYENNPLRQVICQLFFPPILRIGTETPVEFQELIRREYPMFQETSGMELPPDMPPELSKFLIEKAPSGPSTMNYTFTSTDGHWSVNLNRSSVTLTSRGYETWEDFRSHLRKPLEALLRVYSPLFFTRVRLGYVNIIDIPSLGLEDVAWSDLFQPYIACELASDVSEHIEGKRSELVVNLGETNSRVLVRHGTAQNRESGNVGYLIDSNFYTQERTEIDAADGILDVFNRQAGYLFRWAIRDALHRALGPHPG